MTAYFRRLSPLAAGALAAWIYLAVFSDIQHSILLLAYLGVATLADALREKHAGAFALRPFLRSHRAEAIVLAVWLFSLLSEAHGGNAGMVSAHASEASQSFLPALASFAHRFDGGFLGIAAVFVIAALWRRKRTTDASVELFAEATGAGRRAILISLGAMALTIVYLLLVATRVGIGYFVRIDVAVVWCFFLLLAVGLAIDLLSRRHPMFLRALPLLAVLALVSVANQNKGFQNANDSNLPASTCYAVGQDIIGQVQAADRAGLDTVTVHVPKGNDIDNWPHAIYMDRILKNTLYRHGLTSRPMKIEIVPDPAMNETYHLPLPKHE